MKKTLLAIGLSFYVGATAAFLVPFTSPLAAPLMALARLVSEVGR